MYWPGTLHATLQILLLIQVRAQSHGHPKHYGPARDPVATPLVTLPEQQLRRTINSEETLPADPAVMSDMPAAASVDQHPSLPDEAALEVPSQRSTDGIRAALDTSGPSSSSSKPEEASAAVAAVALDDVVVEVASPAPEAVPSPPPPKHYTVPYDRTSTLDEILQSSVRLFGRASRRLLGHDPVSSDAARLDAIPKADDLHAGHHLSRRLAQHDQAKTAHVRAALAETQVPDGAAAEGNPIGTIGEASEPLFRSGFEEASQPKVLEGAAVAEAVPEAVVGSQGDEGDVAAIVSGADVAQHEQMEAWLEIEEATQLDLLGLLDLKSHVVSDPQGLTASWVDGGDPCREFSSIGCDEEGRVVDVNLASLAVSEDVHPQLTGDPRLVNAPQKMVLSELPCSPAFVALGSRLLTLHLDNTRLENPTIPSCWAGLLRIESISCGGCGLEGPLPSQWASLKNLTSLDLSDNPSIIGPLPATWSAMRSLQSLDLSISIPREKRSLLSGGLPVAWRNMVNLTTLNLARTNISGELLPSWGALKKISTIDLSYTAIHGALPRAWSGMRDLKTFRVRGTRVSGALPASWSHLTNLTMVDLLETDIKPPIPGSWRAMCNRPTTFAFFPWASGNTGAGLAVLDSVHVATPANLCQGPTTNWLLRAAVALGAVCAIALVVAIARHLMRRPDMFGNFSEFRATRAFSGKLRPIKTSPRPLRMGYFEQDGDVLVSTGSPQHISTPSPRKRSPRFGPGFSKGSNMSGQA